MEKRLFSCRKGGKCIGEKKWKKCFSQTPKVEKVLTSGSGKSDCKTGNVLQNFQKFRKVPKKFRVPGGCVIREWKKCYAKKSGKKTGVEDVTGPEFYLKEPCDFSAEK